MTITSQIIVAGCGAMGLPMATALIESGFDCYGYDVRPLHDFPSLAPRMLETPCAQTSDTVLLVVVRNSEQIDQLCFEREAVFRQTTVPHTLIISATVAPGYIDSLAARLPPDVRLLDAPMSGAPVAARERTLTFMLGASAADAAELQPLFDCMGARCFHLGATGRGMLAKVCNNYVAATSVVAVRRALARAAAAGLAPQELLTVMGKSSGATWFGSRLGDIDWAAETWAPDNTIGILDKDVRAALDMLPDAGDTFDDALLQGLRQLPELPEG